MIKNFLKKLIRGYQKGVSPLFPPTCIYRPTCSSYALQAIEKHGALKGTLMAIARILRCHPFAKGGLDEVPEHFSLRRNPDSMEHQAEYDWRQMSQQIQLNDVQKTKMNHWLAMYKDDLRIRPYLPQAEDILAELGIFEQWTVEQMQDYLENLGVSAEDVATFDESFSYYHLPKVPENKAYVPVDRDLFEGQSVGDKVVLIVDRKLGILEKTNQSRLGYDYLKMFGITSHDTEKPGLYLYTVLSQMADYDQR